MSEDFEYTILNALLWQNCKNNFDKANDSRYSKGQRFGFGLLGTFEAIPIIGQGVSLIETGVVKAHNAIKLAKKKEEMPQNLQEQSKRTEQAVLKKFEEETKESKTRSLQDMPSDISFEESEPPYNEPVIIIGKPFEDFSEIEQEEKLTPSEKATDSTNLINEQPSPTTQTPHWSDRCICIEGQSTEEIKQMAERATTQEDAELNEALESVENQPYSSIEKGGERLFFVRIDIPNSPVERYYLQLNERGEKKLIFKTIRHVISNEEELKNKVKDFNDIINNKANLNVTQQTSIKQPDGTILTIKRSIPIKEFSTNDLLVTEKNIEKKNPKLLSNIPTKTIYADVPIDATLLSPEPSEGKNNIFISEEPDSSPESKARLRRAIYQATKEIENERPYRSIKTEAGEYALVELDSTWIDEKDKAYLLINKKLGDKYYVYIRESKLPDMHISTIFENCADSQVVQRWPLPQEKTHRDSDSLVAQKKTTWAKKFECKDLLNRIDVNIPVINKYSAYIDSRIFAKQEMNKPNVEKILGELGDRYTVHEGEDGYEIEFQFNNQSDFNLAIDAFQKHNIQNHATDDLTMKKSITLTSDTVFELAGFTNQRQKTEFNAIMKWQAAQH